MFRGLGNFPKLALLASPLALSGTVAYADSKKPIGVYVWGDNSNGLISGEKEIAIRTPTAVPFFEGKKIKDLTVSAQVAVAVLANGQVVQWTRPDEHHHMLKGETIEKVKVWDDLIVALSKSGQIFTWHAASSAGHVRKFKLPSLGWFEKIVDFDMGRDSVVALTSKGHALTGLTREILTHSGQLGVASLSALDPAPPAYEMHSVKLLNDMAIKKVSSGEDHVLFLLKNGTVFGCGSNQFGQLASRFNYNMQSMSVPSLLNLQRIQDISAGANVTFFRDENDSVTVVGNGINGLFGTGSFANVQESPIKLSAFDHFNEYNEKTQKLVHIVPAEFQVSMTHVYAKLTNAAGDWFEWGSNSYGQLGNGKLSRQVKPVLIRESPLKDLQNATDFVAGAGISAAYTKA